MAQREISRTHAARLGTELALQSAMRNVSWIAAAALIIVACGGKSSVDSAGGAGGSAGVGGEGSGGTAGTAGTAGTGGAIVGPAECLAASDCQLFSDCCTCTALKKGDPTPPTCFAQCDQDACSAAGLMAPSCEAGRCVAGFDCTSDVFCNALPPECPAGELPSRQSGCWGGCVPATQCESVPDCFSCSSPSQQCVQFAEQAGPSRHCVEVPKGCEGNPSCACMGASVCLSPYDSCTDLSGIPGIVCSCPDC